MMRKDLIIIPILLVGVIAGSVMGMGYSPAELPDDNQITNSNISTNTSTPATVANNSTQQASTTQKATTTTSTRRTTSSTSNNQQTNTQTQEQADNNPSDGTSNGNVTV
ncbi:hypothetical protein [Methanobacterium sp.]|uniref:hypothetical protein n=1 Tax=Methanobacterium sp. TaxID=2164 RepID=UPI0025FA1BFC|nr:hypothetical protein [Methanobacterium sp.]MBI5458715.1 hypothetical protein [Methanobacterium sp.]